MPNLPQKILRSVVLFCLAVGVTPIHAAVPQDYVVDLHATVSDTSPRITLAWTQRLQSNITGQSIYRRLKGATAWGTALATLTNTQTSYVDSTALAGVEYEYWMQRVLNIYPSPAIGYLSAGVKVPEVGSRGALLLLVDDTMVTPLAPEIAQLRDDLAADGWTVQQITAPRTGTATSTKALVKDAYNADPTNVKMVYILGHVPVPYSGYIAPDGHPDHVGAWPCDGYYGDMDGTWTDSTVNVATAADSRNRNIPGDGKFDQSAFPSLLELQVGRVDMNGMVKAPSGDVSEASLLRRYLRKAHDFRNKQGAYAAIPRSTLIRDGFGMATGEPFAVNGWAPGYTCTVASPATPVIDQAPADQWFPYAANNTYLLGEGNGAGGYEGVSSVAISSQFGRLPSKVVFTSMFGSYMGDWDISNALMRAVLAGNADGTSLGLTCYWGGRPHYFMHPMGMGETIGFAMRASQNANLGGGGGYTPAGSSAGGVHMGLMGDPALRLHIVQPPRNLRASSGNSQVTLGWDASTDTAVQGYHVYRAATSAGPFTRLTPSPQAGTTYTDATAAAGQSYAYMVRTLKLESVPGGTYYNLSLGSMAALTVNAGATGAPANPSNLAVTEAGILTWTDNSSDETGFRIERRTNAGGAYVTLTTVGANANGYTDAGPFAAGNVYYYRVIATGAGGDSIASNDSSFEGAAGFFEFSTTTQKVSKTVGTALIPVQRFGGSTGAVTVNYTTVNSSAVAGTHFTATSGALSWAAGETGVKNIPVPITNTATPQLARQFRISLSGTTGGASIGQQGGKAVLIEDPTATLSSPWSQLSFNGLTDSSPAVEAEGAIGSTTIGGTGLDRTDTGEIGQFIYQAKTGDGMLTAFIQPSTPLQVGARWAVTVRELLTTRTIMAATAISDSAGNMSNGWPFGTKFYYRTADNAAYAYINTAEMNDAPRWIRITRTGNTFLSETSLDGVTWNTTSSFFVPMASTANWGLFHSSDAITNSDTQYADFHLATFQSVSLTSAPATSTPANFALTMPASTSASLTWTASVYSGGYRIERRTENSDFALLTTITNGATTYTDSTMAAATAYQYRLLAYNDTGSSAWSPVLGAATPDGINPALRPGFFTVTPGAGSSSITWTDNTSTETGFQLERRAANGAWSLLVTTAANVTSYADSTALPGVIYEYRIRTNSAAGSSAWTTASRLQHTAAASVTSPVWSPDSVVFNQADSPSDNTYVPNGFIYSTTPTPFVTAKTSPTLRNNESAWLGLKFTVGVSPIVIRELGRWVVSGNSGPHTVKLVDDATRVDVPGGSVSVVTAGAPVGFKYAALPAPLTLAANTTYSLVSQETSGGDQWYDGNCTLTYPTGVATVSTPVWSPSGTSYYNGYGIGYGAKTSYCPLAFTYNPTPPVPFTTGHGMTTLRNDVTGWMGMKFTVGASDILAIQLGRWVVAGNSGTHTVKLVAAATGTDLGSTSVATSGATAGQFQYAPLATAVNLVANSSYYLLSQETAGGDQWYDFAVPAAGTATGYQSWLLAGGLPMDASGNGSATATPASDGLPNLIKYALGLPPNASGHGGRLASGQVTDTGNSYLSFTYTRPEPASSGITYIVEASDDLASWTTTGLVQVSSTVNGSHRTISVRDGTPMAGSTKRFLRLRITQP